MISFDNSFFYWNYEAFIKLKSLTFADLAQKFPLTCASSRKSFFLTFVQADLLLRDKLWQQITQKLPFLSIISLEKSSLCAQIDSEVGEYVRHERNLIS